MSSATLMILGESLDPRFATKLLGMRPSQQWRRGEQKSFKRKDGTMQLLESVHKWGGWKRWSSEAEQKKEFEKLIEHWCSKLTPKKKALARLGISGCEVFLDCCLIGDAVGFAVSPRLLAKLAGLGVTLRVSFYHLQEEPNGSLQPRRFARG
jgi:hypothetical protein